MVPMPQNMKSMLGFISQQDTMKQIKIQNIQYLYYFMDSVKMKTLGVFLKEAEAAELKGLWIEEWQMVV